ncbi:MAG: hypothetical protein IT374_14550 [Polyangiaceae bacterium]|nr:hypothetical protein [Polyangiaceae bacterium]
MTRGRGATRATVRRAVCLASLAVCLSTTLSARADRRKPSPGGEPVATETDERAEAGGRSGARGRKAPREPLVLPPDADDADAPPPAANTVDRTGAPRFIVHVDASARFLAFQGATGAPGSSGDNEVYGAKQVLAFRVDPVVVAGVRAGITLPDAKGWERFGLRSSYETDRFYRSGGTIDTSGSLASSLGVRGTSADLIEAGLHFAGVGFEAEVVRFVAGRVQARDVNTGAVSGDSPLAFTRTRLEASFDIGRYISSPPAERPVAQRDTIVLLADAYSVTLPRIVYLTQERPYGAPASDGTQPTRTTVVVETPPQPVTLSIKAAGAMAKVVVVRGVSGTWALTGAGLAGVATPHFDLPARLGEPMSADNRVASGGTAFAAIGRLGTEFEAHLSGGSPSVWVGGRLAGEVYYASIEIPGEVSGTVGFQDFFITGQGFVSVHFAGR